MLFGAPRLLDLLFGTAWLFWALLAGAVTLAGHAVVCLIGLLGCLCRR